MFVLAKIVGKTEARIVTLILNVVEETSVKMKSFRFLIHGTIHNKFLISFKLLFLTDQSIWDTFVLMLTF